MYDKRSSMTAKQARRLLFALATVLLCVALAQQQAKPNRTVSYFTKNDPKYGEVISALGDEPKCATVDAIAQPAVCGQHPDRPAPASGKV
jgi:hypothetical protein